ncbi:MAG: hypothetical protein ITG07_02765 [Candidimonas sp.]|nr:hypothetical protein [Candidimonas sp.]
MRTFVILLCCVPVLAFAKAPSFGPDVSQFLGGEEGEACQIIMCLSDPAGQDLEECEEPLREWETTRPEERPKKLEKCPMVTGGLGGD